MNELTGQEDRHYEPIGGVVLPNEQIENASFNFFVDIPNEQVFILVQGGLDSYVFWETKNLFFLEDIQAVGVKVEKYFEIFEDIAHFIQIDRDSMSDGAYPLPDMEDVRDHALSKAKAKRSSRMN